MAARRRGKIAPDLNLEVAPEVGSGAPPLRDPIDPTVAAAIAGHGLVQGFNSLSDGVKAVAVWESKRDFNTDSNFADDAANKAIRDMNAHLVTDIRTRKGERSPGSARAMSDYIDKRSEKAMEGLNERAQGLFWDRVQKRRTVLLDQATSHETTATSDWRLVVLNDSINTDSQSLYDEPKYEAGTGFQLNTVTMDKFEKNTRGRVLKWALDEGMIEQGEGLADDHTAMRLYQDTVSSKYAEAILAFAQTEPSYARKMFDNRKGMIDPDLHPNILASLARYGEFESASDKFNLLLTGETDENGKVVVASLAEQPDAIFDAIRKMQNLTPGEQKEMLQLARNYAADYKNKLLRAENTAWQSTSSTLNDFTFNKDGTAKLDVDWSALRAALIGDPNVAKFPKILEAQLRRIPAAIKRQSVTERTLDQVQTQKVYDSNTDAAKGKMSFAEFKEHTSTMHLDDAEIAEEERAGLLKDGQSKYTEVNRAVDGYVNENWPKSKDAPTRREEAAMMKRVVKQQVRAMYRDEPERPPITAEEATNLVSGLAVEQLLRHSRMKFLGRFEIPFTAQEVTGFELHDMVEKHIIDTINELRVTKVGANWVDSYSRSDVAAIRSEARKNIIMGNVRVVLD